MKTCVLFVMQLLQRGHKVIAAARNPHKAKGLTSLAAKYGAALTLVTLDVADSATIKVSPPDDPQHAYFLQRHVAFPKNTFSGVW